MIKDANYALQIFTSRSLPPEATFVPNGLQSIAYTSSRCPESVYSAFFPSGFQIFTVESLDADAMNRESGDHAI